MSRPTSLPVWQALAAEAGIASDQIGEGATLLSKVTPEYTWTFARAFFPLSIGIERACKLALQVDSKLSSGAFMTKAQMMTHGHKLDGLISSVEAMIGRRQFDLVLPSTPIHRAIIDTLTEFATNGRYHHLDDLAGRVGGVDPSRLWWDTVVMPILEVHYSPAKRQRDEAMAQGLGSAMDEFTIVQHSHVSGRASASMVDGLRDGAQMQAAIPWLRLYTLQIARWLAETMRKLSWDSHQAGDAAIPDLQEFFARFVADDSYMKSRKTWRPMG